MHYLVTGHTGFKGAWLSLKLTLLGHKVSGISLDPQEKSLFNEASLAEIFENDCRIDIRDSKRIKEAVVKIKPDVIIHLAAQPLVRESYRIPAETFEINVIGTLNVLGAIRDLEGLKAVLIITTDKVYKNLNHLRGYVESDELGGDDPYSASKAAADIATQSWAKSFAGVPISIARAGNVIGGGDWAIDRLIPDLANSYSNGLVPTVRNPNSIRPWQHVLDCLDGYLLLIDKMVSEGISGQWNFGPSLEKKFTVLDVINEFSENWGVDGDSKYLLDTQRGPHETNYLLLDSTKARNELKWSDRLDFQTAIKMTADWYRQFHDIGARDITEQQIRIFNAL